MKKQLIAFLVLCALVLTCSTCTSWAAPSAGNAKSPCDSGSWPTYAFTSVGNGSVCSPGDWWYGTASGGPAITMNANSYWGSKAGTKIIVNDPTKTSVIYGVTDQFYDPQFNGGHHAVGFVHSCVFSWDFKLGTNTGSSGGCNGSTTISSYTAGQYTATLANTKGLVLGQQVTFVGGTGETGIVFNINGNVVTFEAPIANTGHTSITFPNIINTETIAGCGNCSHSLPQILAMGNGQEIVLYNAIDTYYWKNSMPTVGTPSAALAAGGTLAIGTARCYKVTVLTTTGESAASAETCATPTSGNQTITVTMTGAANASNAIGYGIYEGATGAEHLETITNVNSTTTPTFTDAGSTTSPGPTPTPPSVSTAVPPSYLAFNNGSGGPGSANYAQPFKIAGPGCATAGRGQNTPDALSTSDTEWSMNQTGISEAFADRIGAVTVGAGQGQNSLDNPVGSQLGFTYVAGANCDGAFFAMNDGSGHYLWDPFTSGTMGTQGTAGNVSTAYNGQYAWLSSIPSNQWFYFNFGTTLPGTGTSVSYTINFLSIGACTVTRTTSTSVNGPAGVLDDTKLHFAQNEAAAFNSTCTALNQSNKYKMVGINNVGSPYNSTAIWLGVEDNNDNDPRIVTSGATLASCTNITCSAITNTTFMHYVVGPVYNLKGAFYQFIGVDNIPTSYYKQGSTGNYAAIVCMMTAPSLLAQAGIFTSSTNPTNAGVWTWTSCDNAVSAQLGPVHNNTPSYTGGSNPATTSFVIPGGGGSWSSGNVAHWFFPNPTDQGAGWVPFNTTGAADENFPNGTGGTIPILTQPQGDLDQNGELWAVYADGNYHAAVCKYNPRTGTTDFCKLVDSASGSASYGAVAGIQISPSGVVNIVVAYDNSSTATAGGCANVTGLCIVDYKTAAVAGQTSSTTFTHTVIDNPGGPNAAGKYLTVNPSGDSQHLVGTYSYNCWTATAPSWGCTQTRAFDIYTP